MTAQKGGDPCVLNGLKGRLPRKIPFGSVHREGKKREKVGNFAEATAGSAVSHRYFFVFNLHNNIPFNWPHAAESFLILLLLFDNWTPYGELD